MSQLFSGEVDQLRQFVPVNVNYTPDNLMPTLADTEVTVLGHFIGSDVLEQLRAYASSNDHSDLSDSDSRKIENALFLARAAVGRIGFAAYLPFAEVQIDDDGITVSAASGRKPAFEYQTKKLHKALIDAGWNSLDLLLKALSADEAVFPDWKTAPLYTEYQEAIFKSPSDFSRYYPIQDRWLTFWALRFSIRNVEDDQGADCLAMIDALPDTVDKAKRDRLGRTLRRALAYQAVLDALPTISIELDGVNIKVNYGSQYGNADYYQPPSKEQLAFVMENLQKQLTIAWDKFNSDLTALQPAAPTVDSEDSTIGTGPYSTGAITML